MGTSEDPAVRPEMRGLVGRGLHETPGSLLRSRLLMNGVVLGDDVRGNAATLIDLVAVGLRPLADSRTLLAARTSARPATAPLCVSGTDFARVFHIVGKFIAELPGVTRTQVDLIGDTVETKGHGLGRLAPVEIVDEKHLHLLGHGDSSLLRSNLFGCQRYTQHLALYKWPGGDSKSTSWRPTSVLARRESAQEGSKRDATPTRRRCVIGH